MEPFNSFGGIYSEEVLSKTMQQLNSLPERSMDVFKVYDSVVDSVKKKSEDFMPDLLEIYAHGNDEPPETFMEFMYKLQLFCERYPYVLAIALIAIILGLFFMKIIINTVCDFFSLLWVILKSLFSYICSCFGFIRDRVRRGIGRGAWQSSGVV